MFTHSTVQTLTEPLVLGTVELYNSIRSELLPTPSKSHYTFNLRDLSKVVQGIMRGDPRSITAGPGELRCGERGRGWGGSWERRVQEPLQGIMRGDLRSITAGPGEQWCGEWVWAGMLGKLQQCLHLPAIASPLLKFLSAALALQACWPCGCTSARVCLRTA